MLTACKMLYPKPIASSSVSWTSTSKCHKVTAINITVVNAVKRTVIAKAKTPFLRSGVGLDAHVEADSGGVSILSSLSLELNECNPVTDGYKTYLSYPTPYFDGVRGCYNPHCRIIECISLEFMSRRIGVCICKR